MTVDTLSPAAPGTGVPKPEDVLHQLDELMALPGAQGHHYVVVRQLLITGRTVDSLSVQELQDLTGKSPTTCKAIRRFVQEFEGRNSDLDQDSDACCTHGISTCVQPVQNSMYGAESRLTQQLKDLGWGQKNGRQVQDPDELIRTHGIDRVRQALEKARLPDVKNSAGFITWYLRQSSGPAPVEPAAVHPELKAMPTSRQTPQPTTPELQAALNEFRREVRLQTWQSWFKDCRLTREDETVTVWLSNPYARDWVGDQFGEMLRASLEKTLGSRCTLVFEVNP